MFSRYRFAFIRFNLFKLFFGFQWNFPIYLVHQRNTLHLKALNLNYSTLHEYWLEEWISTPERISRNIRYQNAYISFPAKLCNSNTFKRILFSIESKTLFMVLWIKRNYMAYNYWSTWNMLCILRIFFSTTTKLCEKCGCCDSLALGMLSEFWLQCIIKFWFEIAFEYSHITSPKIHFKNVSYSLQFMLRWIQCCGFSSNYVESSFLLSK